MIIFCADTFLLFADMASFQQQLARPPLHRSQAGLSRPSASSSTLAPATSPAPRSQQIRVSATRPSSRLEKRRRFEEIDLANPLAVNLESVMAATRGTTREAMAEEVIV